MSFLLHPEAARELCEAVAYYEEQGCGKVGDLGFVLRICRQLWPFSHISVSLLVWKAAGLCSRLSFA